MTLTDTQAILLSHAARRDSGSLYPLPSTITAPAGGVAKSIASLIKRGLVEERQTTEPTSVSRLDGVIRYGAFMTAAGRVAIGLDDANECDVVPPSPGVAEPHITKVAQVLTLLGRTDGATLSELVEATGWLPHTMRAALTGLRKKGHTLDKSKRDGATCYRIVAAA